MFAVVTCIVTQYANSSYVNVHIDLVDDTARLVLLDLYESLVHVYASFYTRMMLMVQYAQYHYIHKPCANHIRFVEASINSMWLPGLETYKTFEFVPASEIYTSLVIDFLPLGVIV